MSVSEEKMLPFVAKARSDLFAFALWERDAVRKKSWLLSPAILCINLNLKDSMCRKNRKNRIDNLMGWNTNYGVLPHSFLILVLMELQLVIIVSV